jgi:hypothetical protein
MTKLELGVIEVDDAAAESFRRRAAATGRTIQELAAELIAAASERSTQRIDWLKRIDEIAAMTPKGVVQTDSTEILREIRDE